MKRAVLCCAAVVLSGVTVVSCAGGNQNSAEGVLRVGSEEIAIEYAYVEDFGESIVIMLTDLPVKDKDLQVHGPVELAEGRTISGVAFWIDKETVALNPRGQNRMFYRGYDGMYKWLPDTAKVESTRFDQEVLEGRLYIDEPSGPEENPYTLDVSFSVTYGGT